MSTSFSSLPEPETIPKSTSVSSLGFSLISVTFTSMSARENPSAGMLSGRAARYIFAGASDRRVMLTYPVIPRAVFSAVICTIPTFLPARYSAVAFPFLSVTALIVLIVPLSWSRVKVISSPSTGFPLGSYTCALMTERLLPSAVSSVLDASTSM